MPSEINTRAGQPGYAVRSIKVSTAYVPGLVNEGDTFYIYHIAEGNGSVIKDLFTIQQIDSDGFVSIESPAISTYPETVIFVSKIDVGEITVDELYAANTMWDESKFNIDRNIIATGYNFTSDGDYAMRFLQVKQNKIGVKNSGKSITPMIDGGKTFAILHNGKYIWHETKAGDICVYDSAKQSIQIVSKSKYNQDSYPTSTYKPIGVVVVPNSHTEDGTSKVCALSQFSGKVSTYMFATKFPYMDDNLFIKKLYAPGVNTLSSVDIPSPEQYTINGAYIFNPSVIRNAMRVPYQYSETHEQFAIQEGFGVVRYGDYMYVYYSENLNATCLIPCPYNANGGKNSIYWTKNIDPSKPLSPDGSEELSQDAVKNLFYSMDGRHYTDAYINMLIQEYGTDWMKGDYSGEALDVYGDIIETYKYSTDGTNKGDWYIPGAGEMGYVYAKIEDINNSIQMLGGQIFNYSDHRDYASSNAWDSMRCILSSWSGEVFEDGDGFAQGMYYTVPFLSVK